MISFTDYIALMVVRKQLAEVIIIDNEAIAIIQRWLDLVGFTLANRKTEAVLIISRKRSTINLTIDYGEIL